VNDDVENLFQFGLELQSLSAHGILTNNNNHAISFGTDFHLFWKPGLKTETRSRKSDDFRYEERPCS
jgi:hypothetical protein